MTPYQIDLKRALKWMHGNAPALQSLVSHKSDWYTTYHTQFWDSWRRTVYDLRTADAFGLMIWSIILGVPSQVFGLNSTSRAFAYGPSRQNFVYSGGAQPATDRNTIGGNFVGGSRTTVLNLDEARKALMLRYVALTGNGSVALINYMLRYIFNGNQPWDFAGKRYFYLADSTIADVAPSNVSIWRNDWQGNQLMYATPRTNNTTYSEQLNNAVWSSGSQITVTADATAAPDGTNTADLLVPSTVSAQHFWRNSVLTLYPASAKVSGSLWVKASGYNNIQLSFDGAAAWQGGIQPQVRFNLATGTVGTVSSSVIDTKIETYPDGWYRIGLTAQNGAGGSNNTRLAIWIGDNTGSYSFAGNGTSGVYCWGVQTNQGDISSYIATTSAAVTRTDYTLSSSGVVTFAQAPLIGAALTWAGSWRQGTVTTPQGFGTGDGTTTVFNLSKPAGAVDPVTTPYYMEYRVGANLGLSAQIINLFNLPKYGIMPTSSGRRYSVIVEP